MILESADTAFFFGHSGQDAIMGCDNCGRRVESAHASISASDKRLCDKCHRMWMEGYCRATGSAKAEREKDEDEKGTP